MIPVNLLPWRELERKRIKVNFFYRLALAVILALIFTFLIRSMIGAQISEQQFRNNYLQDAILKLGRDVAAVDTLMAKEKIVNQQLDLVRNLQMGRDLPVYVLETVAQVMPSGAYLTNLQYVGNTLTLQGQATSSAEITELLNNINNSSVLADARLTNLSTFGNEGFVKQQFTISTTVKLLSKT